MAIISEIPEEPKPSPSKEKGPKPQPKSEATATAPPPSISNTNPFHFWFYFTVIVSLITLSFVLLPSFSPQDPKAWFLSLPGIMRQHYAHGRVLKVQITPNLPQVEVFSIQEGPVKSDNQVLIVHGFGCSSFAFRGVVKYLGLKGVHAIAIDLPGSGFSDKSMVVEENASTGGILGRFMDIYYEIKNKGIFWGFDQLVEKGYVDYEENENEIRVLREVVKAIELGPEEMGRVLAQVIDGMGLAPVDLVMHDSALGLSANWINENSGLVRSVMVLDSAPRKTALPLWTLEIPVVREIILGFGFVFEKVLGIYCLHPVSKLEAEAHRILLKGREGRKAVVGMGKRFNYSFDLAEWGGMDIVKGLPLQVIWSDGTYKEWSEGGRRIANELPQATFVTHSGGQWPQVRLFS